MHKIIEERKNLQRIHQEILVIKEEVDFALGRMDKLILYHDYYDDVYDEKNKILEKLKFTTGINIE